MMSSFKSFLPATFPAGFKAVLPAALLLIAVPTLRAQTQFPVNPAAPCSNPSGYSDYGTTQDQANLDTDAELSVTVNSTQNQTTYENAVWQGQKDRNNDSGCPDTSYTYTTGVSDTAPSLATVTANWNNVQVPFIAGYSNGGCPDVGRNAGSYALAAYWAALGGIAITTGESSSLLNIHAMFAAEQATSANYSGSIGNPGAFGYVDVGTNSKTACFIDIAAGSGTVGANIANYCSQTPAGCVTYTSGTFSGKTFQIADSGTLGDLTLVPDGSMDFDHGYEGLAFIEESLQPPPGAPSYTTVLYDAAQWAKNEPAVRNVNYSAKLIWVLAEMYDQSGKSEYQTSMMQKLRRGILYNMMMPDPSNSAYVQNLGQTLEFANLTKIAQRPGRMYDGHNALPDYMSINAIAVIEAYVACRDQGDTTDAATIRPYAIAALDNLANEVNYQGIPSLGKSQVPTALLLGLWKIYGVEGSANGAGGGSGITNWEQAAWRYWNDGDATHTGAETLNAALYVTYLSGIPYKPLSQR